MIDLSSFEGHTPAPWVWNDDWCSALIGLPDKEDADIYDNGAQTVIGVDTKRTPICDSSFPEEQLRNNALRSEDAMLIAYAPLLLAEVKRLRERHVAFMQWMLENYDEIVNEWEASDITEASE